MIYLVAIANLFLFVIVCRLHGIAKNQVIMNENESRRFNVLIQNIEKVGN